MVTGTVFLFHPSPVQTDPKAALAELGWEQSTAHPRAGGAQFHAQAVSAFALKSSGGLLVWSPRLAAVLLGVATVTAMAQPQLGRASVRCCLMVTVSSRAVSWGLCCAIQSQVWLLMSSPNALSWYTLFCVFPAVLLQALAPSPASRASGSGAAPPRDVLATEPCEGSHGPGQGPGVGV